MKLPTNDLSQTSGATREALSALVDDECTHDELDAVLRAYAEQDGVRGDWIGYHSIGEVLRGQADVGAIASQPGFAAAVMARITAEAAASATVAQPPMVAAPASHAVEVRVSEPANDAVFRWRLVAGVAAVAAVASVVWQVALPSAAGPQVAQAQPALTAPAVELAQARTEAVQTDRGVVLRDPRLEALMAAHRQWGGMAALEVPSGFSTASYDLPQR